jgi:hypothetical protein
MIFLDTKVQLAKNLVKQTPANRPAAMVGDDSNPAVIMAKDAMTTLLSGVDEASSSGDLC